MRAALEAPVGSEGLGLMAEPLLDPHCPIVPQAAGPVTGQCAAHPALLSAIARGKAGDQEHHEQALSVLPMPTTPKMHAAQLLGHNGLDG